MSFSKWFFSRLGHRASRHWLRVKNGGQKNNFPVIPPRSTGRTRHKSPVGSINHQNSAHISPSSEPRLPFSFSSLHKEIISWRGKKKRNWYQSPADCRADFAMRASKWQCGMLGFVCRSPPAGQPGLTSRLPSDEWRLSVFVAVCWSISPDRDVGALRRRFFPVHLAEVKNKTVHRSS